MSETPMSLIIHGVTVDEIEDLLQLVREIEQRDPVGRYIFCAIVGVEDKTKEEAMKILREIFPRRGRAG